jgi:hypothetical protein
LVDGCATHTAAGNANVANVAKTPTITAAAISACGFRLALSTVWRNSFFACEKACFAFPGRDDFSMEVFV